jgi:hypothetical protein
MTPLQELIQCLDRVQSIDEGASHINRVFTGDGTSVKRTNK